MGSQLDPLPLSRVGSRERATKSQFPQLDFVKPSSGFHPVTWERVTWSEVPYVAQPSTMVGLTLQSKTPIALELETQMVRRHLPSVH